METRLSNIFKNTSVTNLTKVTQQNSYRICYFISLNIVSINLIASTQNSSNFGNTVFWRLLSKEMSAKSLKFFGPPTKKWRLCKIFAKLNGNHLLMANILKLHEYQTFGLMKIHNMCKIWFANKIFSSWKSLVYDERAFENCIF